MSTEDKILAAAIAEGVKEIAAKKIAASVTKEIKAAKLNADGFHQAVQNAAQKAKEAQFAAYIEKQAKLEVLKEDAEAAAVAFKALAQGAADEKAKWIKIAETDKPISKFEAVIQASKPSFEIGGTITVTYDEPKAGYGFVTISGVLMLDMMTKGFNCSKPTEDHIPQDAEFVRARQRHSDKGVSFDLIFRSKHAGGTEGAPQNYNPYFRNNCEGDCSQSWSEPPKVKTTEPVMNHNNERAINL